MRVLIVILANVVWVCAPFITMAQKTAPAERTRAHEWWKDSSAGALFKSENATKLPLISVRGAKFVDPEGNSVLFRGLSISDPDKIESQGQWNKQLFEKIHETGARLIRIPVHPIAWRERAPEKYLTLLDQAVEWCTELGMYIDIDWHSIGNLNAELFQDPMYQTSPGETNNFWRTIARHYAGNHTVAFYELFNEPTAYSNQLGRVSWDEWKHTNENLIALVRAYDSEKIPLIAGFDWAYDLTPLHDSPIAAEGIGYVTHPYPHKRTPPWEPKWEEDFGFAASKYPIVATEIGFWTGPGATADSAEYGPAIIKYLEGRGISWLAWVYDPEWEPSLIASWETSAPTDCGTFFFDAMKNAPK